MKRAGRTMCASLALLVMMNLTACGASESKPAESTFSKASSTAQKKPYFESDTKVNWFIEDYNEIAEYPFKRSNIKKGNIKNKAIIKAENLYIEVINSDAGLSVSIEDKEDEEEALYPVFRDMLKAMDKKITDEMVEQAWNDIKKGRYEINYGSTTLFPSYEVKDGIQATYSLSDIYGQKISVEILDTTY